MITTKAVTIPASNDVNSVFQPYFLKIKNTINGTIAILCGLVRRLITKKTIDSLGFEDKNSVIDTNRKKV